MTLSITEGHSLKNSHDIELYKVKSEKASLHYPLSPTPIPVGNHYC